MGQPLAIAAGEKIRLKKFDPGYTGKFKDKSETERETAENAAKIGELVYKLYAEKKQSVLIVLQGIDTAGKDGTIRSILKEVNPQGIQIASFKQPTEEELAHDFLWRIHQKVPGKGELRVFNRSHYEDVIVVRVHDLVPREVWKRRYEQINAFEKFLNSSGTTILKFFLHISPEEQKARLKSRLADPNKRWKFSVGDLEERKFWDQYTEAFEEALTKCNTETAPWHIIPADHKWYRNLVIGRTVKKTLEALNPQYPQHVEGIESIEFE